MTHKPGKSARRRRTTIPEKPNYPLNLWSIMKNSIGKELTKIPVPVSGVPGRPCGWREGCGGMVGGRTGETR